MELENQRGRWRGWENLVACSLPVGLIKSPHDETAGDIQSKQVSPIGVEDRTASLIPLSSSSCFATAAGLSSSHLCPAHVALCDKLA